MRLPSKQIDQLLADDWREFEAMPRKAGDEGDLAMRGMQVNQKMLVGGTSVHARAVVAQSRSAEPKGTLDKGRGPFPLCSIESTVELTRIVYRRAAGMFGEFHS